MRNNTIIIGDSYSTFEGFVPEGYAVYYSPNDEIDIGVTNVSETWWHKLAQEANLNLIMNNSWSGSTICYTAYGGRDCSGDSSFICRFKKLASEGFFDKNDINTVFVFGGTNDSWSNAPLGDIKLSDWKESDLFYVLPAICCFLKLLKDTLPKARIYCLVNTEIKDEIISAMNLACKEYGVTPINFDRIDKKYGHPTVQGMIDIKNGVMSIINSDTNV